MLARYPGKVRFVHRDFLLDIHPEAVPAARAARCAGEQGKFWEFHRGLLMQTGDWSDGRPQARAKTLELQERSFGSCLASDRHDEAIRRSCTEAAPSSGVTGTPTYFVNGRRLTGARRSSTFEEIIDAELRPAASGPLFSGQQPASAVNSQ